MLIVLPPFPWVGSDRVHVLLVPLPVILPDAVVVLGLACSDALQDVLVLLCHPQQLAHALLTIQTSNKQGN